MNEARKQLWAELSQQQLTHGDMPALETEYVPWYIALMQGFAGWIAALFMLGFVGSIFGWLFRFDNEVSLISVGLICCTGAYLLFRTRTGSVFFGQVGLAVSLCGQMMVAWGLFDWLPIRDALPFFLLAVFQILLTLVMPNFIHRLLTGWFALIALFWGLDLLGLFGLGAAICSVLFVLVWINDRSWKGFQPVWEPVGYSLALALVQFNGHLILGNPLLDRFDEQSDSIWWHLSPWLAMAMVGLSTILLLQDIIKQYGVSLSSLIGRLILIGGVLIFISGQISTGVSSALLILLVGFAYQRQVLTALGLVALLSFVSWYYYNLATTLLIKSFILMGTGVALLLIRLGVRYILSQKNATNAATSHDGLGETLFNFAPMSRLKWAVVAMMILILAAVNTTIFKKENLLATGETVLLELAPVDPRSLMQGDYMRLRFAIEREFQQEVPKENHDGHVLVDLDKNRVGRFVGIYRGEPLGAQQAKLEYRMREGDIKFATNAFFFQEGKASVYEEAKYGEFAVSDSGELLLHRLRDDAYQILGENQP